MTNRFLLFAVISLAGTCVLAEPAAKKSRIRITRAPSKTTVLPVLGADPALRGGRTGYPAVAIGEPAPRFTGEPISLDLKDADIRDVLLSFSRLARLNMVIDPVVKGSVTVRLENVPWDQALDVILRANGLGYVLEGSLVRVGNPSRF